MRSVSVMMTRAATAAVLMVGALRLEAQVPTVQQVYDKYATAVGGRDAWAKVSGRTEKGTTDVTFAGISGSYERHSALPNKMRMIIDLGVVKIDQGFDGEKGWADQGQGLQRMPADQEQRLAEGGQLGDAFLDPSRLAKAAVEGKETFDGSEAYKLSVTTKGGQESVEYFDVATGLRLGSIVKSPTGEQKVTYRDYKDFEGKKIATKVIQTNAQGDIVINIQIVEFKVPDASLFKAPAGLP
ncbi:MAG: hypothetical protein ACK5W7_13160 [Gemmatimonadaceae bacterium]|jgi:hypothetical protein|nr:hypothetical protein [Gemmatimonadota bacterium]